MTQTTQQGTVKEVVRKYGRCLQLISMDPHFHDVSVALFLKGRILTVWSYSRIQGIEKRLSQIRDRLVLLGDLEIAEGSTIQARFGKGDVLTQPVKFLFDEAVEKHPDQPAPTGPISVRDTKTKLTFFVTGAEEDGRYVYTVKAEGEADKPERRIRAAVGGFMRYGGCERVAPDRVAFTDGLRHDGFIRLLLPYARNVTAVESMLEAADMTGQMNTQTLGFSQS